ncbi:hypothetical protein LCGC14_2585470 [marine sediment metagenome]|uniref:Uncharacterized protein n=1 Tax=marine sediment metagenome TaxID=412755 RepID=A0A0F9CP92_9ZZZZ
MSSPKKTASQLRVERQRTYDIARDAGKTMMQAADEAGVGRIDTARIYETQYNANDKSVISRKQLLIQLSKLLLSATTPVAAKVGCANLISKMQGYDREATEDRGPKLLDINDLIEELQPDEPVPQPNPDITTVMSDDNREH